MGGDRVLTTEQLRQWLASGEVLRFYTSYAWKKKRREVLALDKGECQGCKARGWYRRAVLVHHARHLRERPDLALSIWDTRPDGSKVRQLVSLCEECHERAHPERMKQYQKRELLTKEKW